MRAAVTATATEEAALRAFGDLHNHEPCGTGILEEEQI
jgi:hypothetical protein